MGIHKLQRGAMIKMSRRENETGKRETRKRNEKRDAEDRAQPRGSCVLLPPTIAQKTPYLGFRPRP